MRYYLIAGEASGDLHGSNLIRELSNADSNAQFRFFGGQLMEGAAGEGLVKHYREMAFMGILNVILNIRTIGHNMTLCKKDILKFNPDVLILIDYPGFNLRIAEFAKKHNIKVFYYISPKVWAWKEYRVKKMKHYVDEIFSILPFEIEFFEKHGMTVHFVGNPVMDSIDAFKSKALAKNEFFKNNNLDDRPVVALIAGSRKQEIENTLPVMVKAAEGLKNFQFVVAGVKSVDSHLYKKYLENKGINIVYDSTYNLLNNSFAALTASGTAVLETALFNVPQTVLYKLEGGWIIHLLMKYIFLKINWVSLPNLILEKEAVRELLQMEMTVKNVRSELSKLLFDYGYRQKILSDYKRLKLLLGDSGSSKRTAEKMIKIIRS